jgi:LemA protein
MQARANAANNSSSANLSQLAAAENQLSDSLVKLYAVTEQYPDLKADAIVSDLMESLNSTENKISYARQVYNDDVMLFNNACQVFPNNILASMFRFTPMRQLIINSAAQTAPKVQL